jgi:hypothetical protein
MTQRIFDVENEKDMADLWDILPDFINKIKRNVPADYYLVHYKNNPNVDILRFIKINWHDKTEITRPIQECTEQDVGKICVFWDNEGTIAYGLLSDLIIKDSNDIKYGCHYGRRWAHAMRLTKQEIEELC